MTQKSANTKQSAKSATDIHADEKEQGKSVKSQASQQKSNKEKPTPKKTPKPKKKFASAKLEDEHIYDVLSTAIVDNHLTPETHLPEDELANSFQISRTRIRKVLQRLDMEQLIVHKPNRGAFVASLTVKEAQDIFTARRVVESGLIEYIDFPLKKAQVNQLNAIVKKEAKAISKGDKRLTNRLSGEFHLSIAKLANNDSLYQYLEQLIARTSIAIAIYQKSGAKLCDNACHQNLVDMLVEGDIDKIKHKMCTHLSDIETHLELQQTDSEGDNIAMVLESLKKSLT